MKIQEIEELYKEALQEGGESFDTLAEKMVEELTPKEIAEMAISDPKSLYWCPERNELAPIDILKDYLLNYLKDMGDYLTDPYVKVDPLEKQIKENE